MAPEVNAFALMAALCAWLPSVTFAQIPPSTELVHLDIKGLPVSPIHCQLKDHDGFLWIGTENGLCRYDCVNVDVYRNIPGDSLSLPGNAVDDLVIDGKGQIWVACFGGACVFDPHTMKFDRKTLYASGKQIPLYE